MKLSNEDLVSIIKGYRRDCLGSENGDLSSKRADALNHYHGRPYGNEVEGSSQVVSRDLAETVDWALPAIIRAFVQSGNLGEFDPVGPEDERLAQQESDYTNQVMMKDNPGFMVLHDAIKDTLLLKNGYVKHLWSKDRKISNETYTGLPLEQVVRLLQELEEGGQEVEIVGYDVDESGLYEIKLKIVQSKGKCLWMAVPTEEVRVSRKCRGSLQDSPFTEHVTRKTRSELIEMGMPKAWVNELPAYASQDNDEEVNARDSVDDETEPDGANILDRSMDEIEYCEAYIRVDCDGDGVAELRKVVTCADRIPPGEDWNEPLEAVPMTGFVMKRVPHRHIGESLDDELADLQEIKTTLNRQLLDNIYRVNNARTVVNENINLRDLMTVTPGGVVRSKGTNPVAGDLMPLVTAPIIDKLLPVIEYWDKTKETRTGIRPGSDMDPDTLQDVTKGAYLENLNRLSQKIEMITRLLAESGVKEAFLQVHGILCRHQDQERLVQLRGKWVRVNPREWKERTDLTVRVGLGTGNEAEKRQKLAMLAQMQMQLMQAATQAPPPVYAKMYALFEDMAEAIGFEMPEKYGIAPNSPDYAKMQQMQAQRAQQPPPEVMAKQAELQQTAQLEMQRMQMQQQTDSNRQEMEARQQQSKMMMERELAEFQAQLDMQIEQMKIRAQAETDIMIARIKAESQIDAAQLSAQTTLSAQQEAASDGAVGL